jgi:hypothetical protein
MNLVTIAINKRKGVEKKEVVVVDREANNNQNVSIVPEQNEGTQTSLASHITDTEKGHPR